MTQKISIFWFRRDLRLSDNTALNKALASGYPVFPIFIFDREILDPLPEKDARVDFIYEALKKINQQLYQEFQSGIMVFHGKPIAIFKQLLASYAIQQVYANHDYEPYALKRDLKIESLLVKQNVSFFTFKDQVIFEKKDIVKEDGNPYVVYTPFMRKWKAVFNPQKHCTPAALATSKGIFSKLANSKLPDLDHFGFKTSSIKIPPYRLDSDFINQYEANRNFPANTSGCSRLGVHLRFGTISIRKVIQVAIQQKNEVFWNELIWREFFMQILWHFPYTVHRSFRSKYDRIVWRNNPVEFDLWKKGKTGYPLVDAGMRELNATGHMHNRVRMLVASFLCKHLLIDWRWGEAYFAEKLLDYELSSNVGNWQWAAGTGVDAAPYFRIFNPTTQIVKFDKEHLYINRWVPDLQELTYPSQIVDHKMARERCLAAYKKALE